MVALRLAATASVAWALVLQQPHASRPRRWAQATLASAEEERALTSSSASGSGELAATVPALVTIEAVNVLVRRSVPSGLLYRDTLLRWTGLMLPRPDVFQAAYEAAVAKAESNAPRFGSGASLEEWWRQVTRETLDAVVTSDAYDEDELAAVDAKFDDVFKELYDSIMVGPEAWMPAPDAPRLLEALRQWRDLGGGPRIGVVSTAFDDRLPRLLQAVLGEEDIAHTFDFVVGASGTLPAFERAAELRSDDPSRCVHIAPADVDDPDGCDYAVVRVASAATDVPKDGIHLLDLLDTWNLPKTPQDDLVVTTRLYSVYDEDPQTD